MPQCTQSLGKRGPGPAEESRLPGTGGMKKSRWRRRGVVGGRQKLDRLSSLQMRGEKERLAQHRPLSPQPSSQRGLSPWRPPGSSTRREKLREGPEELTYFGTEVAALGPAEGGERGAEREQGEQEAAGGSRGGRHGPRRRGAWAPGGAGSAAGPTPWGRAAALLGRLCLLKERNVDS